MCGIIGCSTPSPIKQSDVRLLYLLAEQRGGHACGFTNLKDIYKDAIKADVFVSGEHFNEETRSFIGHTRYATKGNRYSDDNAHPFNFEKVIGVHNGTIFNHEELQKEENTDFDVDSQFLYYMIDKYGLKDTLPKLEGKLALAFHTKETNTDRNDWALTLYRFDRPLWYGWKGDAFFYGSEKQYLQVIDCAGIKEVQENTIYRVKYGRIISAKQVKKDKSPRKKEETSTTTITTYSKETPKTREAIIHKHPATNTKTVSGMAHKPPRTFHAPVYAELCELGTAGKTYYKLFWFDDDDFNVVYIEDDSLANYYTYYNLDTMEGLEDMKSDHSDIMDEVLDYHLKLMDDMSVRSKLEEEANGTQISKSCSSNGCS